MSPCRDDTKSPKAHAQERPQALRIRCRGGTWLAYVGRHASRSIVSSRRPNGVGDARLRSFVRDVCRSDARIAWSPVAGSSGYKIYVRASGAQYGAGIDVGARTPDADGIVRFVLTGLNPLMTSYFAVTNYDATSTESQRSNELDVGYPDVASLLDSDGDGLTDALEDRNLNLLTDAGETNRLVADTDGDGVDDGTEVAQGQQPARRSSSAVLSPGLAAEPLLRVSTRRPPR